MIKYTTHYNQFNARKILLAYILFAILILFKNKQYYGMHLDSNNEK